MDSVIAEVQRLQEGRREASAKTAGAPAGTPAGLTAITATSVSLEPLPQGGNLVMGVDLVQVLWSDMEHDNLNPKTLSCCCWAWVLSRDIRLPLAWCTVHEVLDAAKRWAPCPLRKGWQLVTSNAWLRLFCRLPWWASCLEQESNLRAVL